MGANPTEIGVLDRVLCGVHNTAAPARAIHTEFGCGGMSCGRVFSATFERRPKSVGMGGAERDVPTSSGSGRCEGAAPGWPLLVAASRVAALNCNVAVSGLPGETCRVPMTSCCRLSPASGLQARSGVCGRERSRDATGEP